MVALVEAVEVYETANNEYKAVHGYEAGANSAKMRFTNMRSVALGELVSSFWPQFLPFQQTEISPVSLRFTVQRL